MALFESEFSAADDLLSEMFDDTITYRDVGGPDQSITAEVRPEYTEPRDSRGVATIVRSRHCTIRKSQLPTVNVKATIVIDDEEWAIARKVSEDALCTVVVLERIELREHTRPGYRRT